jgi:hypothetical protein
LIQFVDEAIERLLRREVPLPEGTVDVSFAAPDRTWGAGITRPTVNVFLWDIRRNSAFSSTGLAEMSADRRTVSRRPAAPVVDLRYLVTAWAAEHRDEHQLLGAVLRCVLATSVIPADLLPVQLSGSSYVNLSLASEDSRVPGDFWSALDGRLKPGLQLLLTLPLDLFAWTEAGPPAQSVGLQTRRLVPVAGPDGNGRSIPGAASTATEIPLRRRRQSGMLTMEGRRSADDPASEGESEDPDV